MIRTLSTVLSNSSSNDHSAAPIARRFTLNSLAARLSNSKKHLLDQLPHQQQQWTNIRKRAKLLLASSLHELESDSNDEIIVQPEIISVDEIYRRFNPTTFSSQRSYEFDVTLPKLLQPSKLIDDQQLKQILLQLPARVQALDWYLLFSTELHGFSLNQLYRRSYETERDSPSLLIIRDIDQNIFGAFASHALLISEGFYGNGESFLFTFYPAFRAFNWSGTNDYFVKGDTQSIGFGSADGHYALWLDGDLYRGRTCFTRTFRNDPLTAKEDFLVSSVELWTFVDHYS